jgi:hypothetical protein
MPTITIDVDKWKKLSKKEFAMQYLFQKANGVRERGEATASEIYIGWAEACLKLGTKSGKVDSFRYEMWKLHHDAIVEVSGTETGGRAPTPGNIYILTHEYFVAMGKK